MPAYLAQMQRTCTTHGCKSKATMEVFDAWNGSRGIYCLRHAQALVKDLNMPPRVVTEELTCSPRA